RVPVTDSGRILGSALMVIGVLFVSVMTSYVTTALFILRAQRQTKPDDSEDKPLMLRLGQIEEDLAAVRRLLEEQD
ncbi:MAG: two pore domain potassium channel family protein, partial [Anaerolineaceae bacterium]